MKRSDVRNAFVRGACGLTANANVALLAQANISRSDPGRGREADVLNRCRSLLDLGNENAETLAPKQNVSAAALKALRNGIAAFDGAKPKPRLTRASKASATRELATLFNEAVAEGCVVTIPNPDRTTGAHTIMFILMRLP